MTRSPFHSIAETELQDFHSALAKQKRSPQEFEISETRLPSGPLGHLHAAIKVTATATGASREYRGLTGSTWTVEFENDLRNHFFG
jgi:hypothetical protein